MDHKSAQETYAAERYLLGEMPPAERDEFEEHFFSCRACGDDVHTASLFAANAKAVFSDRSLASSPAAERNWFKRDWLSWLRLPVAVPAFAALVLASIVTYQNAVMIPQLRTPQSMAAPVILAGETRSSQLTEIPADKPLRIEMPLIIPPPTANVYVELLDASGKTVRTASLPAPGLDQPLDVYFPGRFQPGRYTFIARSEPAGTAAGQELARSQFEIVSKGE